MLRLSSTKRYGIAFSLLILVVVLLSTATGDENSAALSVRAEYSLDSNGRTGSLAVTADIREGHHIYGMAQPQPFIATQVRVDDSRGITLMADFTPSQPPKVHFEVLLEAELHEHEGQVTFSAPFELQDGVSKDDLQITGHVFAQACNDNGCLTPRQHKFVAQFKLNSTSRGEDELTLLPPPSTTPESNSGSDRQFGSTVELNGTPPDNNEDLDFDKIETDGGDAANMPLLLILPIALVAGFILNFMPCVLPVLGLKIMSFAQQAGDSRTRVLMLNLWYTLGMICVFLVLATLAVFLGMGWGQQFSSVTFNVVLASIVFVFGLSFLGVWEIPIPGFAGSGMANELADREGPVGAFSKGVLTTVLATPCSGPLLGTALTWAVTQPPLLTYLVFLFVGLGMASPYLLAAAFPNITDLLPKPGAWMNTFKQSMGFVLLATVAYLLTFISIPVVVPMVVFLIGLGIACWWIGRVPLTENLDTKVSAWIQAGAVTLVVGFFAFGWLHGVMFGRFQEAVDRELARRDVQATRVASEDDQRGTALDWQPYSHSLLKKLSGDGKTVLVDFTADWCLTCKSNEAVALNTAQTKKFIESNGIVTLKADKTGPAPEADELLKHLGNKGGSIPFYAIFPASNPNKPVLLDGLFTSAKPILDALKEAGPSVEPRANNELARQRRHGPPKKS